MKKTILQLRTLITVSTAFASVHLANAQSTWGGGDIGNSMAWSDANNWSAGGAPANDSVTFPDGAYPITTNVQGAVNNIVSANTLLTSLTFANNGAANDFDTTLIPSGSTLTVSGGVTIGNAGVAVYASFTGGGSLFAGTNGTSTLAVQSTSGTATLDLSTLTNFSFNYGGAGSTISLSTGSSSASGKINLAAGSNNITATTLSLGNNNTGGTGTMNLGNGTNIINADTISMGIDKTVGVMQFLNNAGGSLTIANHTGTGRGNISLSGTSSSGTTSATNTGTMSFNGGTVNILAGTLIVGNRGNRSTGSGKGGAIGSLSFNNGIVDATTVIMATNVAAAPAYGTISVGGSGVLKVGTGSLLLSYSTTGVGAGTLIVTNGGTVICSNNIYKGTGTGVGTIMMNDGSLNMASLAGTIGVVNSFPIDNFNVTNSTLTLPVTSASAVIVNNFNPDTATTSTINIGAMPSITAYPSTFQVITYATPGGNLATDGILSNIALGTLPNTFGAYAGYLSNDTATATIWLVITNGPSTAKADEWGGGVNNQWNTTSLNWTNNSSAVKYNDGDFVTFDDLGQTNNVNLTATRKPGTLAFNNSVLNYTLSGTGSISGPVGLVMNGSASLKLTETGGDNFSLGITNNAGTLVLDDASSAISGGLQIASGATVQIGNNDTNGALPSGSLVDEGTLIFDQTNNVTVAMVIPDGGAGGALIQNGSGTLTLSVSNTYSGNTTVNNGTLALAGSGSIADSSAVQVNGATLDVAGVSAVSTTLNSLTLSNASLNVKVGYLQTNLTVNNSLTMGGAGNTINVHSLPAIAVYPATVTLLQTLGGISGYNFGLGSLPVGSPAYVGTIAESGDGNSVLLTLTSGPTNTRPAVTWSGVDALNTGDTNWSDAQNWQTPGVPAAAEPVFFNDAAVVGGSPFNAVGDGIGGIVNPSYVDNFVNISLASAALNYANDTSGYHNTQIGSGKTLTVNGSMTVDGAGGTVTILGSNAVLQVNNSGNINVENSGAPTLDMSGLDTFIATVNQIGVGFNTASAGSSVSGTWYLAKTNIITTGVGNFGTAAALVVGGSSGAAAGIGELYLGQTNVLYVDGIVLGASTSTGDLIEFNPVFANPVAYIRGISGNSSRVTSWSLGDDSANINNANSGSGFINDFTAGTLNALVGTLIVGQGAQGNEINTAVKGTFNMGAGNLDVTTLDIGIGDNGKVGGAGVGVMNVAGGTVIADSLGLAIGTVTNSSGTLNLTSGATLVVSNGITIGTSPLGSGNLSVISSTIKILNGTIGSSSAGLTTLNIDGATLQLNVNGNNAVGSANLAAIVATNVTTGATTTINIGSVVNVSGTVDLPLISYVGGTDPTTNSLALGTLPAGYTGSLVDDTANNSIDLSITLSVLPTPHITGISVSGTTLTISATNGANGGQYVLLGTTNLTLPLSQWTPILTNNFNGSGNLNLSTNIINPAVPHQFYILMQ